MKANKNYGETVYQRSKEQQQYTHEHFRNMDKMNKKKHDELNMQTVRLVNGLTIKILFNRCGKLLIE